jgi:hypothetical protein
MRWGGEARGLTPLRVRVHPSTIQRFEDVAAAKNVPPSELQRAAIERVTQAPGKLEEIADELRTEASEDAA